MPSRRAFVVAIVGAESTGKTTLARALADSLHAEGLRAALVTEYLREFCDTHGRTPRPAEQATIAAEQTRRIEAAAAGHEVVIADTTALMTAVYSDHVFGDTGLYDSALAAHARADLTLLAALDLPWRADGLQRDGPHVRQPVDDRVRAALHRQGLPYAVVAGSGAARHAAARAALAAAQRRPAPQGAAGRWRHWCARCGDADCERHLFDASTRTD